MVKSRGPRFARPVPSLRTPFPLTPFRRCWTPQAASNVGGGTACVRVNRDRAGYPDAPVYGGRGASGSAPRGSGDGGGGGRGQGVGSDAPGTAAKAICAADRPGRGGSVPAWCLDGLLEAATGRGGARAPAGVSVCARSGMVFLTLAIKGEGMRWHDCGHRKGTVLDVYRCPKDGVYRPLIDGKCPNCGRIVTKSSDVVGGFVT